MKKILVGLLVGIMLLPVNTAFAQSTLPKQESLPEIVSDSAIVIDAKTGTVIYNKNASAQNYPASITKVMTALLVLEKLEKDNISLDALVPFSKEAVLNMPYNSSNIAMDYDDYLEVGDALYALMLASANEVANALAEYVSGTQEKFAELMTRRAKELGAVNTHFTNPHGLYEPEHYTTAKDMALIMREASKYSMFRQLISTASHEIPPTLKQPLPRPLHNSNKMIQRTSDFYDEDIIGGKTGFTNESMHTLVSLASKDDKELIIAVLHDQKNKIYSDTTALADYGFTQFSEVSLSSLLKDNVLPKVSTVDGEKVDVEIKIPTETFMLPTGAVKSIKTEYNLNKTIAAPIVKGDRLGKVDVLCNDYKLTSLNLTASQPILVAEATEQQEGLSLDLGPVFQILIGIAVLTLVCVVVLIYLNSRANNRRRRRQRVSVPVRSNRSYRYKNDW